MSSVNRGKNTVIPSFPFRWWEKLSVWLDYKGSVSGQDNYRRWCQILCGEEGISQKGWPRRFCSLSYISGERCQGREILWVSSTMFWYLNLFAAIQSASGGWEAMLELFILGVLVVALQNKLQNRLQSSDWCYVQVYSQESVLYTNISLEWDSAI